jgi:hypothetical protein
MRRFGRGMEAQDIFGPEQHIESAVEYVVNGQGGDLPTFD